MVKLIEAEEDEWDPTYLAFFRGANDFSWSEIKLDRIPNDPAGIPKGKPPREEATVTSESVRKTKKARKGKMKGRKSTVEGEICFLNPYLLISFCF